MPVNKKLAFCLLLGVFLAFLPIAHASADSGRYFIKSTKGFWRNALGVRHTFNNGFSSDLSDFQFRLAKMFGVDVEPVAVLQILPDDLIVSPLPSVDVDPIPQPLPKASADAKALADKSMNIAEPTVMPTATITPATIPTVKSIRSKDGLVRYFPSDQTPWGLEIIYNNQNLASTSGGVGVNVAILDTGVYSAHPDLTRRIAQCKDFTNIRLPMVNGKCEDKNGHGTHVAGIVVADAGADGNGIYGVAPEANIFAYKVCGANGSCYADDIAAALDMAASEGANIVNMSFGSDQESLLIRSAVAAAVSKGVLLVAAAGNDGPFTDSIDYPAAYPSVVAVGAINQLLIVTDWSSHGVNSTTTSWIVEDRDIELAVPGEYIESTWNNGSYVILSGTSMASPFVAGLAAKFWPASQELQRGEQADAADPASASRNFIHSLAKDILPFGDDDASGFGLPQVK